MTLSSTDLAEETMPSGERREVSAVIVRARAGDAAAFGDIFQLYSWRVIGLCRHMLRDKELAEDAAGEVFLRLRTAIASYDGATADGSPEFDRWLLRIAANYCIDLIRRRQLERRWISEEPAADPPSAESSPLTLLLLKERRDAMARAVEGLADAYRVPLALRYYAGLSYDEIAAELDMEKTQVAGRIFRAKHMLRKLLEEKIP